MDYGDSSWLSDQEISGPSNTHVYRNLRPRQHVAREAVLTTREGAREAVLTTREGVIISRDGLMTSRDYVVSSQRPSRYQNELRQSKKIQKGRELDLLSMRGHGRTPSVTHKGRFAVDSVNDRGTEQNFLLTLYIKQIPCTIGGGGFVSNFPQIFVWC